MAMSVPRAGLASMLKDGARVSDVDIDEGGVASSGNP